MIVENNKVCVLVSGGLDSAVLLSLMAQRFKEVYPVYVLCGLFWEKAELYWLKKFLKKILFSNLHPLKILQIPVHNFYENHWSLTGKNVPDAKSQDKEVYLPGRNLLLLSQAATYCALEKIKNVALGILKSNPFPDSQPAFFSSFEKAGSLAFKTPFHVLTPLSRMTKSELVKKGKDLPLEWTFSCLRPKGYQPCRNCNKCEERRNVMSVSENPFLAKNRSNL
ncbi:MAG: 7-cyano-7-deazaguanine synthase [Chlamydiae bacterium]|nr:7-cyano-7-deazaguanine synthase [Chlamydiota bacterium]MBI3277143.1 7-cyano-7-deazaguanine synthase [Chlamydiota bacterium]